MNNRIKGAIIFVAGAGIGALSGALLTKRKYEAIVLEEVASIREYSNNREYRKNARLQKENLSDLVRRYDGSDIETANALADPEEIMNDNINNDYAEYERISYVTNTGGKDIYVITTEEYSMEHPEYDKLTITYYEDDDTLADENEEIISDVLSIVGDALDLFGQGSDDPEVVYVRNNRMSIDYEVICVHKSYKETVGI